MLGGLGNYSLFYEQKILLGGERTENFEMRAKCTMGRVTSYFVQCARYPGKF